MKLSELKEKIKNNTLSDDFLILLCEENHFIADQYAEAISRNRNLPTQKISSLAETKISALSLVIDYENCLKILVTDNFDERVTDYAVFTNTIVICDKIDKTIKDIVSDYVVDIPKLADWCIKDFIKTLCPALNKETIEWLYSACGGNIYKINNELDKIRLFDKQSQVEVLNQLRFAENTDLYQPAIGYKFAEALISNDLTQILSYFKHQAICNYEPMAIVATTLSSLKKAVLVNFNCGKPLTLFGIEPKVAGAVGRAYKNLRLSKAIAMIDFLSNIESGLRTGELDMSSEELMEYIICHVMAM